MKGITASRPGGPEVLQLLEFPPPSPGPGEVLVRIAAAGVNRADVMQRMGNYPPPPGHSEILGLELSGTIETGTAEFPAGMRVMALVGSGAYATHAIVPTGQLMPIPESVSVSDAAAIPEAFLTAFHNLFDIGCLKRDEAVLINAAGSGVGTAAIQLAHRVGARVFAVARSPQKLARCAELGADVTICTGEESFVERITQETAGAGVNLILDFVGASYLRENLNALARGGRIALIGMLGGARAEMDLGVLLSKRLRIQGSTIRAQSPEEKAALVQRAWPMIANGISDGALRPIVDRTFSIEEAAEAHRYMETSQNFGKILLTVPGEI